MLAKKVPDALTQADDLPSLPAVAVEILHLTQDDNCDPGEFAAALSSDPALVALLLKYANSAQFGARSEISSVRHSIMMLGIKTVKTISLSFALTENLKGRGGKSGLDLDEYWRRSLVGAVSARGLVHKIGVYFEDEAFLCGLLAHFGKLVLDSVLPDDYAEVMARSSGWPSLELEEEVLGYTSADVATAVLREWGLPDIVSTTIGFQQRPAQLSEAMGKRERTFVEAMHLNGMLESLLCDPSPTRPVGKIHGYARNFNLTPNDIEEYLARLGPAIQEASRLFNIDASPPALDASPEPVVFADEWGEAKGRSRRNPVLDQPPPMPDQEIRIDPVTALPDRTGLVEFLHHQTEIRANSHLPGFLGLIVIHIDQLGGVQAALGPEAHDDILREIRDILGKATRKNDFRARCGPDRFAIALATTSLSGLKVLAERLLGTIAASPVEASGRQVFLTASIGAACLKEVLTSEDDSLLLHRVEGLLESVRRGGGNGCAVKD